MEAVATSETSICYYEATQYPRMLLYSMVVMVKWLVFPAAAVK